MAMGRPPKPTAVKELAGNPGMRPLNRREPKPAVMIPDCPTWVKGEARKEYMRTAEILVRTRVLTEADYNSLATYAYEVGEWIAAIKLIRVEGTVITSEKGGKYLNPRVGAANMHLKNMIKLMQEFGLTPASRTRIHTVGEEKERSLAEALFDSVTRDE